MGYGDGEVIPKRSTLADHRSSPTSSDACIAPKTSRAVKLFLKRVSKSRYWELNWTERTGERKKKLLGRVDVVPKRDAEALLRIKQLELSAGANLHQSLGATRRALAHGATLRRPLDD
jgi:hypothetical protein